MTFVPLSVFSIPPPFFLLFLPFKLSCPLLPPEVSTVDKKMPSIVSIQIRPYHLRLPLDSIQTSVVINITRKVIRCRTTGGRISDGRGSQEPSSTSQSADLASTQACEAIVPRHPAIPQADRQFISGVDDAIHSDCSTSESENDDSDEAEDDEALPAPSTSGQASRSTNSSSTSGEGQRHGDSHVTGDAHQEESGRVDTTPRPVGGSSTGQQQQQRRGRQRRRRRGCQLIQRWWPAYYPQALDSQELLLRAEEGASIVTIVDNHSWSRLGVRPDVVRVPLRDLGQSKIRVVVVLQLARVQQEGVAPVLSACVLRTDPASGRMLSRTRRHTAQRERDVDVRDSRDSRLVAFLAQRSEAMTLVVGCSSLDWPPCIFRRQNHHPDEGSDEDEDEDEGPAYRGRFETVQRPQHAPRHQH